MSMRLQGGPAQQTVPANQTQACEAINKALFDPGLLGWLWMLPLIFIREQAQFLCALNLVPSLCPWGCRALGSSGAQWGI